MPTAAELYYHAFEGGEEGQRPPVVLLHSAGGTHLYWPPEMRRLAGYRVYAPDLPGHGKSGGRGQQTIAAYANFVIEWLEAIGLHSAVFVGHSMGSAIALTLALQHADHVLGLGLIGAGARMRIAPALVESTASPTTYHNAIQELVACSFGSQASPQLLELAARRMEETRPSVLHGDFLACQAFDESERVSEVHQPALIVCGNEDRFTPPRDAQFLGDNLPKARLELIPGAGHMVMLEQPRRVADTLVGFLNSIPFA
jgi:pimeloyl-ACP methyl ester carboxylesterase